MTKRQLRSLSGDLRAMLTDYETPLRNVAVRAFVGRDPREEVT